MSENVPIKRERNAPNVMEGQVVSPWRDPTELFRDVDTIFNRMVRGFFDAPMSAGRGWGQAFTPPVDIEETDDAYIFEFDLPGIKREQINIEAGRQELHIYGEIVEKERTGIMRHRTRRTGSFDYRVSLPSGTDPDRITAKYTDGVLTVTVPRAEGAKPRRIDIG